MTGPVPEYYLNQHTAATRRAADRARLLNGLRETVTRRSGRKRAR